MTSTRCPVTRVALPANLSNSMKLWRDGFLPMPQEYIEFHLNLAEKRLQVLKDAYGFRVVETKLKDAGWFDGMKELNAIIETKRGSLHKLVWCDSNQDFMEKMPSGGSGSFNAEVLFLGEKPTGVAAITF